jgi:hypothetical protein
MSEQKHIIKRQIIELTVPGAAEAQRLQDEVSRIYRQRIVPLIDQYCTELSEPDRLHRIESLVLDVGALDIQRLEADLVAKVSAALYPALADRIGEQERGAGRPDQDSKAMSQLEMFALFARTGSLPWWADASQPRLLEDGLQYLLQHTPEPLRRLMRELAREGRPLQRIVEHIPDALLAALARILAPAVQVSLAHEYPALIELLQTTQASAGRTQAQLRRSAWRNILHVAGLAGSQYSAAGPFYQAVLRRVAAELGTTYGSLLAGIQQIAEAHQERIGDAIKGVLEALDRESPGAEVIAGVALTLHLAQLQPAGGPLAGVWAALGALDPQLATSLWSELLVALSALGSDRSTSIALPREAVERILQRLRSQSLPASAEHDALMASLQLLADEPTSQELLEALSRFKPAQPDLPSEEPSKPTQMPGITANTEQAESPAAAETTLDLSFSDADELYIGNAGLVILWPFLGNFFARLGLLEGRGFKDSAAQQRAAGLLQYIATQDLSFPEYLLPLNKVLCGLELTEVFDFGAPLLDSEAEECADLLRAVIAQAPILRDMSPAGFCGTFLLRQAVLSARDGAWLLRVERETFDIVLDCFPWGWEWVRLPWMAAPLRVEW